MFATRTEPGFGRCDIALHTPQRPSIMGICASQPMSPGAHLPVTVSGLHDCDLFTRTAAAIASKLGVECIHNADVSGGAAAWCGLACDLRTRSAQLARR